MIILTEINEFETVIKLSICFSRKTINSDTSGISVGRSLQDDFITSIKIRKDFRNKTICPECVYIKES